MKTALVFPGQGSQAVGMGKALADAFPAARAGVRARSTRRSARSSRKLIFEGPEAELTLTANAQPALMATSMAALRALETEAGLDRRPRRRVRRRPFARRIFRALRRRRAHARRRGATAAHARAGDADRRFPPARARWRRSSGSISPKCPHIALQAASELYLTGAICEAANDNGGGQVVISGTKAAVERAMELAKLAGAKRALPLPSPRRSIAR